MMMRNLAMMNVRMVFVTALVFASVSEAGARVRSSFNDGWSLIKDGRTETVEIPHDWAIAGPFDPDGDGSTGKLPWRGSGTYRKTFVCTKKPRERVFLDFDGVMARSVVFVNGNPCGKGVYGYLGFRADATPYLLEGTNVVEVCCDTLSLSSRWYPGGGLYRNTWMIRTDDVYIADESLRIVTSDVMKSVAKLTVRGSVVSRRLARTTMRVSVRLTSPEGVEVATGGCEIDAGSYAEAGFDIALEVPKPELWEMNPGAKLYVLAVSIKGENANDEIVRRVGFREYRFDHDRGFLLNGTRVQLKGVNLHSDLGPLGMAFNKDAMRRQLDIMRDMGANAIRTSHNCPAPELLDICDEMGFFVWDECFDKWNSTTGRGDEPLEDFVERVLAAWIRRDRCHPSVFTWSIGNEISPGAAMPPGQEDWAVGASWGTSEERCARFRNVILAEDDTRPVSIGSCFSRQVVPRGDYAPLDLTGWNYGAQYLPMWEKCPDKPVLYSESASALSEYGYYSVTVPSNKTDYSSGEFRVDSRDLNAASWSDIPDWEFYRMECDQFCAGEFVWTGIDYLGEPSPYAKSSVARKNSRSSYFGICDLLGFPKDRYYLYRSYWNEDAFTLHIVPGHWNFDSQRVKSMPVMVYTSANEAELFVNGRSMGRRKKDRNAWRKDDYYSVLPRYRLIWDGVRYEPGEIKAVAYDDNGRELGCECLKTAGTPKRIVLSPEKRYGELCVIRVQLADAAGNLIPDDERTIRFCVEGGAVLAVGNSDPRGMNSFKAIDSHPLCFGRAGVFIRVREGCLAKLVASADGVESAEITIR